MTLVLCVHGIAQQSKGEDVLASQWGPALRAGLRRAGGKGEAALALLDRPPPDPTVGYAFYGDLFRPAGRVLTSTYDSTQVADATDYDIELLRAWWRAAADTDPGVVKPDERTLARAPQSLQAALRALSTSRYFAGLAERALLSDAIQVRRYFTEPELREQVQHRIRSAITPETRVVVAHSLGTVVAYEALVANPDWPVSTLITLGSPLGIRGLIYDRLLPPPPRYGPNAKAIWPGRIRNWQNIVDQGDIVALVKDLRPLFGESIQHWVVHNGTKAHDVSAYLTSSQTGAALAAGILPDTR